MRFYPTQNCQAVIDRAISIKAGKAELLYVYIDVEPIGFNRGFYTVDVRYYYRVTADAFIGAARPVEVCGLCVFDKRVILFGSEGTAKVFSSEVAFEGMDEQNIGKTNLPTAVVEAVDPIVLNMKLVDVCECRPCDCELTEIPPCICACFGCDLCFGNDGKRIDLINVLIINIFAALATGGAVVCAQSIGAQNLERANRAANQLLYIVTAAALGIMVLVLFCKAGLLGLLFGQVEPEVMEGAVTYFVISALSYPFIAVYNGCAALLRAMGNSKASMCVSAYMNGQNIAGNAVFVFVFHQGVAGVALSSLLSRIAAAGLMLALLHGRRNPVRVSGLLRFRFEPAVMAQILRIGVPNSLENSFFQLGRVLLVSLISTFGTAQTAANAVANNIDNFGVIPGQALGLALITVVGQCVGAGDWDQVRAYTKRLVKLTYLCTWGLNAALLLGLPLILRLYSLTPETQWYAAVLIFIHNGCAMLFWPLAFTMPNALRAAGDVRVPMVISITSMLVVRVGGSYLLGLHFGLGAIGVWLAMVGDWVVRLICFVLRARKKLWLEHR